MININSALIEQIVSLLTEYSIPCSCAEAPGCTSLTFFRAEDETLAISLISEHFGKSAMHSIVRLTDAAVIFEAP